MKELIEDRGNSPANPFAAIVDIEERNAANEGNFSAALKQRAEKLRKLAAEAHKDSGRTFAPNYRAKDIRIKVEGARPRDKLSAGWPALEEYCDKHGVEKHVTKTGWIYVIK